MITIDTDFVVVDNLETVTYEQKLDEQGYGSPVTVASVLRRVQDDSLESVMLGQARLTFHIWTDNVAFVPAVNDRIIDAANNAWTVKNVATESFATRYKLSCLKEIT